jgi:acyl-coenzyme A synthetase/AMP-(fatty) acid ligase
MPTERTRNVKRQRVGATLWTSRRNLVEPLGATPTPASIAHTHQHPTHPSHTCPEFDMEDSNRLFRFPKPAWMNSANTRTAGVYMAGALVRSLTLTPQTCL